MYLPIDDEIVMTLRKDTQTFIYGLFFTPIFFAISVAFVILFYNMRYISLILFLIISTFSLYLSILDILSYFYSETFFYNKYLVNISFGKKNSKIFYDDIKSFSAINYLGRSRVTYKVILKDNSVFNFYHNHTSISEISNFMKKHGIKEI